MFKKIFAPISILLAWFTIIASLLAYSAPYISPNWCSWLPFFGLFYPLWLVAQLALLPFLYKYKKKLFVYLLLTTALGYSHFFANFQPIRNADKRLTPKSFTLMSYNIGGNGLDKKLHIKELLKFKMQVVRDAQPDILCLQELRDFMYPDCNTVFTEKLPSYPYSAKDKKAGVGIFSNFPIRRYCFFILPTKPNNVAMYADIGLGDRTFRVFNIHLQSNKLGADADNFVKELDNIDEEEGKATYIRTFRKLRTAWQKRAIQANIIADSIAASPYPTIVCGDFNDTPSSYSYRLLSSGLHDAFRHGGRGNSFSYNGNLPAVSIDHILVAKNYPVYGFRVVRKVAGDHYPVRAEIGY